MHLASNGARWTPDTRAFAVIGTMPQSYVKPPRFTAELYRALGDIPGVTVDRNAVSVAGQRGIGFRCVFRFRSAYESGPKAAEIIVSRPAYAYIGDYRATFFAGSKHLGDALVRQALVPGPGIWP
jgi:hypothetical protein